MQDLKVLAAWAGQHDRFWETRMDLREGLMLGTETEEDVAMGEGVAVGNPLIDPEAGGGYACARSSSGAAKPVHASGNQSSSYIDRLRWGAEAVCSTEGGEQASDAHTR